MEGIVWMLSRQPEKRSGDKTYSLKVYLPEEYLLIAPSPTQWIHRPWKWVPSEAHLLSTAPPAGEQGFNGRAFRDILYPTSRRTKPTTARSTLRFLSLFPAQASSQDCILQAKVQKSFLRGSGWPRKRQWQVPDSQLSHVIRVTHHGQAWWLPEQTTLS